ncbi:protein CC2D2B isoform X1 [Ovis aries]|uniref:protein CC2D2B isoform X1 n=1 Tax=Ovis aries TaxID=9940 RepID=UPI0029526BB9|nr:protein CC2D2B isoform X1 [Ovis aries]
MERARKVIPSIQHTETPVYLGATAGMRLLRMENKQMADKILAVVASSISKYPFDFQGARIISGQEEGAYGWITVNYLLGKFTQKLSWFNLKPSKDDTQETYGALDLGGASTQITFVPRNETTESPDNNLYFRLYGKNYNVYTHSFLCYGKDQALFQKLALGLQGTNGIIREPCFHSGYRRKVKMSVFNEGFCTMRYELNSSFYPLSDVDIRGTGRFRQCQQSIIQLFNTSYCPYSSCSFNGVFLPPLQGQFGAFSAFYYVMEFLNFTSQESTSVEKLTEKLQEFCAQRWEEVEKNFGDVKEKYLSEYCFSGTYILVLLLNGYHFTAESWKNIHFMNKMSEDADNIAVEENVDEHIPKVLNVEENRNIIESLRGKVREKLKNAKINQGEKSSTQLLIDNKIYQWSKAEVPLDEGLSFFILNGEEDSAIGQSAEQNFAEGQDEDFVEEVIFPDLLEVKAADYKDDQERIKKQQANIFVPSSSPVINQLKLPEDMMPRILEEEGFYIQKKPEMYKKTCNKMENRLLKLEEGKCWFEESGEIMSLPSPIRRSWNFRLNISKEPLNPALKTMYRKLKALTDATRLANENSEISQLTRESLQDYYWQISDTKQLYELEKEKDFSLLHSILRTWKQIKSLRQRQGFTSTSVKLQFQRLKMNKCDEQKQELSKMSGTEKKTEGKAFKNRKKQESFSCLASEFEETDVEIVNPITMIPQLSFTEELTNLSRCSLVLRNVDARGVPEIPWLINAQKLFEWANEVRIDPNNPECSDLMEFITYIKHKGQDIPKYFRLEQLQDEFNFASEEEMKKSKRFQLLQLRNAGQLDVFLLQQMPLYDTEIPDLVFQDRCFKSCSAHSYIRKNWLGSIVFPFSALLQQSEFSDQIDILERARIFTKACKALFPKRRITTTVFNDEGIQILVIRYIKALNPPQQLLDMFLHDSNARLDLVAHFVSLIPIMPDALDENDGFDIWMTSERCISLAIGNKEEHAILLCNFFLYFGKKALVLLGTSVLEGPVAYVLTQETDEYLLWNPLTGQCHKQFDPFCPLQGVDCLFDGENVWFNLQQNNSPMAVYFDYSKESFWKQLLPKNYQGTKTQSIQPEEIIYSDTNKSMVEDLKNRIERTLKCKIMEWRPKQPTRWNRQCTFILRQILPKLELGTGSFVSSEEESEFERLLQFYWVTGFPIQMPYTDVQSVIDAVYQTGIHSSEFPQTEFALAVYIHPYPNNILSVWVYLASLARHQ